MNDRNDQTWSPNEIVEPESRQRPGLIQWWYDQTAIPDEPATASFARREAARKSHFLSTIIFWLLFSFVLFIPGCFVVPNHYIIYADIGMLVFCVIAIFFNRARKPQTAGVLLTIGFELALTAIIFTTRPYDEPSIQQYELFVFGELLCVSLLAPNSVFIAMVYNIAIIATSLFLPLSLQPRTVGLIQDLQTQWIPILVRPVAIQVLVASVCWLWVHSATQAIRRADRAEMVAKLEHELSEQKRELEAGIQQILQTHVEVANGNLKARAPLTQDHMLWQIARALNNLLVRLQRSSQAEGRLLQVEKAVNVTVQTIQYAEQMNQKPHIALTQTEIDPLIAALQGKTVASVPLVQHSPSSGTLHTAPPDASSHFPYHR
jgi:hypothetical protein